MVPPPLPYFVYAIIHTSGKNEKQKRVFAFSFPLIAPFGFQFIDYGFGVMAF